MFLKKKYVSPEKEYELKIPFGWNIETDPEGNGNTRMIYDKNGKCTLRITTMFLNPPKDYDKPGKLAIMKRKKSDDEFYEKNNLYWLKYSESGSDNKGKLLMNYWIVTKDQLPIPYFIVSLTIPKDELKDKKITDEIKTCNEIIESLVIN